MLIWYIELSIIVEILRLWIDYYMLL